MSKMVVNVMNWSNFTGNREKYKQIVMAVKNLNEPQNLKKKEKSKTAIV